MPDVHAMTDIAAEHYDELRFSVKTRASRVKKRVEGVFQKYIPFFGWALLYSQIQFGHERFVIIRQKKARQNTIIKAFFPSLFLTGSFLAAALFFFHRL